MTVSILTRVDSDTLTLPELRQFVGREVEIVVRDRVQSPQSSQRSATAKEWEDFFRRHPEDLIDPKVYREYREYNAAHAEDHLDGSR